MDPIALQRQIRNNSNDLVSFCSDLKQWGEEMKHKDEALTSGCYDPDDHCSQPKNKVKKKIELIEPEVEKPKKKTKKRIKSYDYSAWEKFDVDSECAKVDEEKKDNDTDGDLTDEYDEDSHDQAIYEKEKGNKFVKNQKWDQAILCYTKAIEYYAYDPIFYANRALCYLKKENYKAAETDCTSALRLDKTYVKAYQRRSAAREALNQLTEAHADLLKVFDYEPNNKESKLSLSKLEKKLENVDKKIPPKTTINQRPKSKFTISQQNKSQPVEKSQLDVQNFPITSEPKKNSTYWSSGNEIELVRAINKPPHLRSKVPLRRIPIQDLDADDKIETDSLLESVQPWPRPGSDTKLIKCDDMKVVERKIKCSTIVGHNVESDLKQETDRSNATVISDITLSIPTTSIQFTSDWRQLEKCKELRYKYLKQINPDKLPFLFKESLDCDIFSGIIHTLAETFIENNDSVYAYIFKLSEVKRFSMLTMFMTDSDKKDMKLLADYMHSNGIDAVDELMAKYDL